MPSSGRTYKVQQGDCMASIAFDHGFFWETLWDLPENQTLRLQRKDPNILCPGDLVFIPDKRQRREDCSSDTKHQFRRLGVPEVLNLEMCDVDGNPRADWEYILEIDNTIVSEGVLDGSGLLNCQIPPKARMGKLFLRYGSVNEEIILELGAIDPIDTISGVQARLKNLGFECGSMDGEKGNRTTDAISSFQQIENLSMTGEFDDEMRKRLEKVHGF